MAEVREEATYVRHHKKKIAYIFSAMRHFAKELKKLGWTVKYTEYEDGENSSSLHKEVGRAINNTGAKKVIVTEPGEWRLREDMETWQDRLKVPVEIIEDTRFICSHKEFQGWASGRKQLRMEYFYREMRKKTGLLMDGNNPVGGKWNYDSDNRKPAGDDLFIPEAFTRMPDETTKSVLKLTEDHFADHFGDLMPFWFPVTRRDAESARNHFIEHALPLFGDYQDAMLQDEKFLYHSLLSLHINSGLLDPMETCRLVEKAYYDGHAPLNAVEGFIRQIIGWREYVRGIYWLNMPEYVEQNYLSAHHPLPDFYWTGNTDMACMRAAIHQTKEEAYAHHIQRLMVTGNFALLVGVSPKEIHEWYLAVYADAYEWVELPNTLGMTQFADGGLLGSKPYAASGNYINKMSNYCADCNYNVKKKTGEGACPFNSLYWHFVDRNTDKLRKNPRMAQIYRTWEKMSADKRDDYLQSAEKILKQL